MSRKLYEIPEDTSLMTVNDSAVAYSITPSISSKWNPNVPFHGTQEEWWEHFRCIEVGEFMTIEEADKEFETWKKEYLASHI